LARLFTLLLGLLLFNSLLPWLLRTLALLRLLFLIAPLYPLLARLFAPLALLLRLGRCKTPTELTSASLKGSLWLG
jgi:hypothetical protein